MIGCKPLLHLYYIELFNEFCTLFLSYMMIIYSDFVQSYDIKDEISYIFLSIFGLNIAVNLIVVANDHIRNITRSIKKCKNKTKISSITTANQ